jgi:hypothetical protein
VRNQQRAKGQLPKPMNATVEWKKKKRSEPLRNWHSAQHMRKSIDHEYAKQITLYTTRKKLF